MNMKPGKKQLKNRRFTDQKGTTIIVAGAILLIGITIGLTLNYSREKEPVKETAPVAYNLATMEISRQFACSCGSCGEKNLAACECPVAIDTKRFIEMNLKNGLPEPEVTSLVNQVYGHYKG